MKTIAIVSGKGGVGKSTITAGLAVTLAKQKAVTCIDCDVDAPNLALAFGATEAADWHRISTVEHAKIDPRLCTHCGICQDVCYFNAIGDGQVVTEGCEGCGACELACPEAAISMKPVKNASLGSYDTPYGFRVYSAQLDPGLSGSGKVVSALRAYAAKRDVVLIDAAAGIGCPVIASITGVDYAVVVTEPTPASTADARRITSVLGHFNIPYGFVVNKSDLGVSPFPAPLATLPYDRAFPESLGAMQPIVEYKKTYRDPFKRLAERILAQIPLR